MDKVDADAKEIIEGLVFQFGYWSDNDGGLTTGGLSVLEDAFDFLGWEDPHPIVELQCDEPGCLRQNTCGFPVGDGYRRTCFDHSCFKGEPNATKS